MRLRPPRQVRSRFSRFSPCEPRRGDGTRAGSPRLSLAAALAAVHGALQSVPVAAWSTLDAPLESVMRHVAFSIWFPPLARFQGLPGLWHVSGLCSQGKRPSVCSSLDSSSMLGGFAGLAAVHICVVLVWMCHLLCTHTQE